jgi:hypothetical protein
MRPIEVPFEVAQQRRASAKAEWRFIIDLICGSRICLRLPLGATCANWARAIRRVARAPPAARLSPTVASLVEVLLLFGAHGSTEDRVAVGEAAEAQNDVAVMLGVTEIVVADGSGELDGAVLVRDALGVRKR